MDSNVSIVDRYIEEISVCDIHHELIEIAQT